ncbi:MAG: class I SAM-dependent methyltransferase [Syntrophorhabdus aromaticivorans]|uniref:Class I SAM-dependent methyltransferase n=2 Tax=Syntrophorhabdus aromaticivorans TaxID=328301 RepID=A0A351U0U4_9BACT|nr:class I SAM-dependent methyltransferase [Syntrophorhabdus aromaticivorans]HBA53575.1 class I SAM-dependent methyltransferase [Syntrophorhabdus aromaticivorans]
MSFIGSNWERYFENPDEGLGTTYERFVLHQYYRKLKERYSIGSVLEVPSFGMTGISGINSMWWAHGGTKVTVADENRHRVRLIKGVWQTLGFEADFIHLNKGYAPLPFRSKSFDMGWNFAALHLVSGIDDFLGELARVAAKVIFIVTPNDQSLFQRRRRRGTGHGTHDGGSCPGDIKDAMRRVGWHLAEEGYLDVPPWPDIAMKKEDYLRKIGLKWMGNLIGGAKKSPVCILDYYNGKNSRMEKEVLKFSLLEHSPKAFKRLWAHHRYFIFTPGSE